MLNAAVIENGRVVNVIVLNDLSEYVGVVEVPDGYWVGDLFDGVVWSKAPAGLVVSPPIVVSPRQIRQALTQAGLRAQVEAAIAAGTQDMQDWWQYATAFEEDHPLVTGMADQLGKAPAQVHALFQLAASL